MEQLFFIILYFIYWIIYYIIEGTHDAYNILWQQTTEDLNLTDDKKILAQKYSKLWHMYDAYEKALTHIVLTLPIFLIGGSIWLFLSLILLSVSIRILLHDYYINKVMGRDVNTIGTVDWFDLFILSLEKKGISQWIFKFTLLIISIIFVITFLVV